MECDICRRPHDSQRQPFLCTVDARNKVYEGRMKQLELLLANETFQNQINQLLEDTTGGPSQNTQETALAQQYMAEQKTDEILQAADRLREEIQAAREEIRARKARLARRRSDLASVSAGLAERRARQQKDIEKTISMLKFRWAQSAEDMAATRAFLCTEAVRLYGLKRSSKRSSTGRYEYHLGKVPVVDLTTMDSLQPEVISTSLSHIAHILILISHYLAIRLPAEITLPHRDYPRPTIFNLQSSYRHLDTFPTPEGLGTTTPPGKSTGFNSHVPRPRPLFVEKPLPQLSKEDPATYSFFLEGVTLLAYNIAWLCCSQGVSVGDKTSFEDVCNMGRNLYGLLMGNYQGQGANALTVHSSATVDAKVRNQNADPDRNWFGRYSHGTSYYFLGAAEGTELVRSFKIPNPVKLADKLKKKLIGDAPAPDWEMLDDDAWREESVSNGNGTAEPKGFSDKAGRIESPRGSSNGWMKVKNRS